MRGLPCLRKYFCRPIENMLCYVEIAMKTTEVPTPFESDIYISMALWCIKSVFLKYGIVCKIKYLKIYFIETFSFNK